MVIDWPAFESCLAAAGDGPRIALKIVVFDDDDYAFARATAKRFPRCRLSPARQSVAELGREKPNEETTDFAGLRQGYAWLSPRRRRMAGSPPRCCRSCMC